MVWYGAGPLRFSTQQHHHHAGNYGFGAPRTTGWGGQHPHPSQYYDDPWQAELTERRWLQEPEQRSREQELLRLQQEVIDEQQQEKRQQARLARRRSYTRRVVRRLRFIAASIAARKIQRWWRGTATSSRQWAGKVVLTALRRNVAVCRARGVATSLRQLRDLESAIEAMPAVSPVEAGGVDKTLTKEWLVFEHTLEKLVLSADNIPTRGSMTAKAIRKRLVVRANTRLQAHDEMTNEAASARARAQAKLDAQNGPMADDSSINTAMEPAVESDSKGLAVAETLVGPRCATGDMEIETLTENDL